MSLLYVLHFAQPLAHAQHYVGISTQLNLYSRLRRHARGNAARITQVLHEQGIEWELGGLMQIDGTRLNYERLLKRQKHSADYCQICRAIPKRLKGTTPISLELVSFATDSESLRKGM